jgi:broad specificity phosphatase PhoE
MKWPVHLTLIRHGQSAYNELRIKKEKDPLYQEFLQLFKEDHSSPRARESAEAIQAKYALGVSDYNTPLTTEGIAQAHTTGIRLGATSHQKPHTIFVSPYRRTQQTLLHLVRGWPALKDVDVVVDDRIREQEHGLSLLYNDWRVFHVMHPEQRKLHKLQGPYWYQYPQGESVSQVRDRSRSFASMLIRECAGKRVLVVTHHLTILSIRANLERLSAEEFMDLDEHQKPVNCGVTSYIGCANKGRSGRLELESYNFKYY